MGGTIGTDQAGTVDRKNHRQVLQCHIVDDLVVTTLQKSRVDGHHRPHALASHACRQCDCVLLGDAHVDIALWETLVKLDHARALSHGGRDADQTRICLRHVAKPLTKHLRERGLGLRGGFLQPHRWIEFAGAVISHRIGFGQFVALTLFGDHMQELRSLEVLEIFECGNQRI